MNLVRRSIGTAGLSLVLAIGGGMRSAVVAQETVPWPGPVETRVRAAIAGRLGIDAENVVLEWGPYRGPDVDGDAVVELVGRGAGGHWVARATSDGAVASVRVRGGRLVARRVAARRLERGDAVDEAAVGSRDEIVWGTDGASEPHEVVGWIAQRTLDPGDPLVEPAVRPPLAVVSGRPVRILWTRGPVGITAPGTATGSGPLGSRVSVRTESGKRLSGVVVAPGTVNVSGQASAAAPGEGP